MVAEEQEATKSSLILDSLEIRGFRGFRHLQIERLGRVNLIVGKNNVGKTALLEAILLYANRGSSLIVWQLLENRNEGTRPIRRDGVPDIFRDRILAIRHLFYGRVNVTEQLNTIEIGPAHLRKEALSLKPRWSVLQQTEGVRFERKPLTIEEVSSVETPLLDLAIQFGTQPITFFRLDTFAPVSLETSSKGCVFVPALGVTLSEMERLWDNVSLTALESDVIQALRIIAPEAERVNLIGDTQYRRQRERIPIVKIQGLDEPLPLRSLGEGMNRLFGIALALVNAKGGILLIDEVESGLHYSVQPDVWKLIFETAARLNVQVFATTHSWDCIEAFQKAAAESDEEGMLIRLAEKKGEIIPTLFDERRVGIATREDIEIR